MKTIITGSRNVPQDVAYFGIGFCIGRIYRSGLSVTEIVSGGARGPDSYAIMLAQDYGIPLKVMAADWDKHGKPAGMIRNAEMAKYADALIAIWDGQSSGTRNMIEQMKKGPKPVFIYRADKHPAVVLE